MSKKDKITDKELEEAKKRQNQSLSDKMLKE